jgi:diguanylate cyclase
MAVEGARGMNLFRICIAVLCAALPLWAGAQTLLKLDNNRPSQPLWPHAQVWIDASRNAGIDSLLQNPPPFEAAREPSGTLGVVQGAAWFRFDLQRQPGSSERWVFDWGYSPVERIDAFLVRDGKVVYRAAMGHEIPAESRPLPSRTHSVVLALEQGAVYQLYLRGQARGSLIAPMRIATSNEYYRQASTAQTWQGLYFGFTVALLLYTLIQLALTRRLQYLGYVLVVAGCGLFYAVFHGMGPELIMPGQRWFWQHAGGISAFVAIIGSSLFFERMLHSDAKGRWFSRLLWGCMAASALFLLLFCVGVLSNQAIVPLVSAFGLAPVTIAAPRLLARLRRAESISMAIVAGWTVLTAGNFVTTSVLRGALAATPGNLHAFQIASVFEMLAFLYALSEQARQTRKSDEKARIERDYLQTLAYADPLTGLKNRRGLVDTLDLGLARATAAAPLAIYVVDLDGFKAINDRHGHNVGDELLMQVAARLKSCVREQDTVARTGGDEFVLVAQGLTPEAAESVAQSLLQRFEPDFDLSVGAANVGLTVGYALGPTDDPSPQGLMRRADQAMYEGKRRGKAQAVRALPASGQR